MLPPDESFSDKLARLTSKDLRAAIEACIAASPETGAALEAAIDSAIEQQRRRRAIRAASGASERSSSMSLTPLYSMLFEEGEGEVLPITTTAEATSTPSSVAPPAAPSVSAPDSKITSVAGVPLGLRPAPPSAANPVRLTPAASHPSPSNVVTAEEAIQRKWRSGFIFFCRHDSFRETFDRMVFGLARHKLDLISQVEPGGTAIFLFDQTFRCAHSLVP